MGKVADSCVLVLQLVPLVFQLVALLRTTRKESPLVLKARPLALLALEAGPIGGGRFGRLDYMKEDC